MKTRVIGYSLLIALPILAQSVSPYITIDQFGYRPGDQKTSVIRDPQKGPDAAESFSPGKTYKVINAASGEAVYSGTPETFRSGATDVASGDQIWWFDFSAVSDEGSYYILDSTNNVKSYPFRIAEDVYNDVLKDAVRMFFFQRAGIEKAAIYAGSSWADGASHLQDSVARSILDTSNALTSRDLRGGWYDAGDYNKYTAWTASYIETMMIAYLERPKAFTDDYDIPESGNGIPDILDEAIWGLDWLLRMQNPDGSVLSVVGESSATPPSSSRGASYYGLASTNATMSACKAYAISALVLRHFESKSSYAQALTTAASSAWTWANAHPDSIFHNNSADNNTKGLAAGDQEDEGANGAALERKLSAALYLSQLLGDESYLDIFEESYSEFPSTTWNVWFDQYRTSRTTLLLYYLSMKNADASAAATIKEKLNERFDQSDFAGALDSDGYRAYIKDYNWGSNAYKAKYGLLFDLWSELDLEPANSEKYHLAAEDYLHYIHGVNPFGMVYLTNMSAAGASNSLTQIYHSWFADGSAKWDSVSATTPGPAPGFLSGGPNENYTWDACCPSSCGSAANNAKCLATTIPENAPSAKMYKDFNTSWPLNSWAITEPSGGYQTPYIRLLSRFVEEKGSDIPTNAAPVKAQPHSGIQVFAFERAITISSASPIREATLYDTQNRIVLRRTGTGLSMTLSASKIPAGIYFLKVRSASQKSVSKIMLR